LFSPKVVRVPVPGKRAWFVVVLALSAVAVALGAWSAEVHLGISRTETAPIPASLIRVEGTSTLRGGTSEVRAVLEGDLNRSLVFAMEPPPGIDGLIGNREPRPALIRKVGERGIQAAIWIFLEEKGPDIVMEGRVYDGASGARIFGKRYIGEKRILRRMIHRFSDEVVFRYTGERGISQTRIAYVSKISGAKEVYVMDSDGYSPRRVTADRSLALSPEWSPDGRWITYTSYREGNPDIFTLELDTGRRWKVVGFPGLNISPDWSPEGQWLSFASTRGGTLQLYRINRDGSGLTQLTRGLGDNLSPSYSPTGQEIAFISNRGGTPQVYLVNGDGASLRRLTYKGSYNTSPAWSPKGDWIAYTCQVEGSMRICLITPDGSHWEQLTDGAGEQEDPAWSPDGRHLVYRSTEASAGGDLFRISINGSQHERLTFNGAQNSNPVWGPNLD
jgi:TolB protein